MGIGLVHSRQNSKDSSFLNLRSPKSPKRDSKGEKEGQGMFDQQFEFVLFNHKVEIFGIF